jgi:hypothetical protein
MTSERLHGGGHHEEGYDGNADQRQRSTRSLQYSPACFAAKQGCARAVIIKIDGAVVVPANSMPGQWGRDHIGFLCKWRSRQMAVVQCAQNAGMDGERLCRTLDFFLPPT